MKKLMIFGAVFLSSFAAIAYEIQSLQYNDDSKTVEVILDFEGGLKPHHFTVEFDACNRQTEPYGLAARILDSGWDDTGTEPRVASVIFQIEDTSCLPAELTVFAGHSRRTILIK